MEQSLRAYLNCIEKALFSLDDADAGQIRLLLEFHLSQTAAFQHERLIHLLVTFFFALFLLGCIVCTLVWPTWQFFAADFLLIVVLLFYIKHYFFLENNVQKLYPITEALYRKLRTPLPPRPEIS